MKQTIAFFGLGRMGLPMAGHLVTLGHEVRGVDPNRAACEAHVRAGGQYLEPSQAVAGAGVVITMLPDGKVVQQALLEGDRPLVDALQEGAIVIDMSSSSPVDTLELGRKLEGRGIVLLDAPVSGGVKKAEDASLTIMVGGAEAAVARVRPLLEAMGARIFETGILGSGHAMKALNNYVSAAGLAAACEAVIVGRKFGLDPEAMVDILNVSTGRNNSTEVKMKPFVLSQTYDAGFGLALMAKDLRTADELAHHVGFAAPLSRCCQALWTRASETLGPGADHTEIYRFLEQLPPDAE